MKAVCKGCGIIQEIKINKKDDINGRYDYWNCKHCTYLHMLIVIE